MKRFFRHFAFAAFGVSILCLALGITMLIWTATAMKWISYGFGTANYAGTIKEFGLALKLQTPTVVSKLTIQQNTGTGGSFTVYTNSSASLDGAVEVGKGTFEGKDAVVTLDTSKQSAEKGAYVIIVVNELPRLSLPIGTWNYGLRINEIKVD